MTLTKFSISKSIECLVYVVSGQDIMTICLKYDLFVKPKVNFVFGYKINVLSDSIDFCRPSLGSFNGLFTLWGTLFSTTKEGYKLKSIKYHL